MLEVVEEQSRTAQYPGGKVSGVRGAGPWLGGQLALTVTDLIGLGGRPPPQRPNLAVLVVPIALLLVVHNNPCWSFPSFKLTSYYY
jgi:hypothetical protein